MHHLTRVRIDWRDDPQSHPWQECCCRFRDDGHCWLCSRQLTEHTGPTHPWLTADG